MKKKHLFTGWLVVVLGFSNTSYADFTLIADHTDSCKELTGTWTGQGKASHWFIGECRYHGVGVISPVEQTGRFKVEIQADKDSGSILCPAHAFETLPGICADGKAVITTPYGNLTGFFNHNSGSAEGVLNVSPGVNADISLHFSR